VTAEPRLTLADCHAMTPRYCNAGNRAMCARLGIDWSDFRDNGVPLSLIEHIDDAMLQAVIAKAKERQGVE
jgi:hypothetical protein